MKNAAGYYHYLCRRLNDGVSTGLSGCAIELIVRSVGKKTLLTREAGDVRRLGVVLGVNGNGRTVDEVYAVN